MTITLYPHQQRGVNEIRGAFMGGCSSVLYVLATGGGKTRIFSHFRFKSQDDWAALNARIARIKGLTLPEKLRRKKP